MILKTLMHTPSGNAVTRQVARAKHAVAVERAKMGAEIIGSAALSTGIAGLIFKLPSAAIGWFTGGLIGSSLMVDKKPLKAAIDNCKQLKASSEYNEITARAKQIYKK